MPDAAGSSSGSADGGISEHEFNAEVRKYFTILCIPVAIAIIILMCIPNLPKPTEQLSICGRFRRVRKLCCNTLVAVILAFARSPPYGHCLQTWEVATTREMLIMAPYCFHIGIAIGFSICESSTALPSDPSNRHR